MAPYIILLLIIILVRGISFRVGLSNSSEKLFVILTGIILVIFSSLRGEHVGTDTQAYLTNFKFIDSLSLQHILNYPTGQDIGYQLCNKFIALFTNEARVIIFLNSLVINFGILRFIYQNSSDIFLSVYLYITLYYFCVTLNIQRQFLSIAVFLIAISFLEKRKNMAFVILILIASSIHSVGIFLLLFLILYKKKPSSIFMIRLFFILVITSTVFLLNPQLFVNIVSYYDKYRGTIYFQPSAVRGTLVIWFLQIAMYIFVIFLIRKDNNNISSKVKHRLFVSSIMVIFGVVMGIIGTKLYIVSRMVYVFNLFILLLIPDLINIAIKEKSLAKLLVMFLLFLYFVYNLNAGGSGVVPYYFFWQARH